MEPKKLTQRADFLRLAMGLGVRVEAPFSIVHAGGVQRFDAYLPDFGGENGMVLLLDGMHAYGTVSQVARDAGRYFSALNAASPTSEEDVKATLNDWGFFGPEDLRPAWYSGEAWGR